MFLLVVIASTILVLFLAVLIICCRLRHSSSKGPKSVMKTTNGGLVLRQNKWTKNGINLKGDAVIDK